MTAWVRVVEDSEADEGLSDQVVVTTCQLSKVVCLFSSSQYRP